MTVLRLKLISTIVLIFHPWMSIIFRTNVVCHTYSSHWHHLYVCFESQVNRVFRPLSISHFSNQYQRFILIILCLETVLNLLLVSLMDPGYVLDELDYEDEIDKECPVTCSRISWGVIDSQLCVITIFPMDLNIVKIVLYVLLIEIIIVSVV